MKNHWMHYCNTLFFGMITVLLVGSATLVAGSEDSADKTLSPYFFVNSDDATDRLPLKSTAADVTISGVIADVEVTQVYKNEGKNTLEAIYIFPGSTRAAVYAMRMTIGSRTIEAKIQEREQARKTYETALAEGKTASLLEQQRPNVFQMNVGNILPGDEITVKLNYTELLVPENAIYEFVYPTVVGPRYSNRSESQAKANDKWVANPYLTEGKDAPFTFAFSCKINSGMPIAQITSPSHEISLEFTGKSSATVNLVKSNTTNNRDVVIQYSLAGDAIESGLLLNLDKKEDFFLLMVEPPKRVQSSIIVPREYIFILDVSGSMSGYPLNVTKALMKDLLGSLRPSDYFNVLLFAGNNSTLSPTSLPANATNLQRALDLVDHQQGGGGTELMPALKAAMALPRAESNISRSMIIATDGYVDVEKDAFDYISSNLDKGNVFTFGIGSSVNRFLIEGMAHAGMGEPFVVLSPDEATEKAKKLREYIDSPVLTDISISYGGLKTAEVEPKTIPDLFARKPVVVFGKYSGTPEGVITITGKTAAGAYKKEIRVSEGSISTQNKALRYLWARHKIMRLADLVQLTNDDARRKEVTELGLAYNLLTDYTSFVAVDNEKRTTEKPQTTVKQPLPLPQGVSNSAVGSPALAPPPSSPAMMPELQEMKRCLSSTSERKSKRSSPPPPAKMVQAFDNDMFADLSEESEVPASSKPAVKTESLSTPHYDLQIVNVTPPLDSVAVRKVFATKWNEVITLLSKNHKIGACKLLVDIDGTGTIITITIRQDGFNDRALVEKIVAVFKKLRFAPPGGTGGSITILVRADQ